MISPEITSMYKKIKKKVDKKSGARFHKAIFHLHTPASHDYGIDSKNDFRSFEPNVLKKRLKNLNLSTVFIESLDEKASNSIYISNETEMGLYVLIAKKLMNEEVRLVLVSDHNTLEGAPKLEESCKLLGDELKMPSPKVVYGIEISCSDLHHVVVILDKDNKKMMDFTKNWLEENIISPEVGTYLPSLIVIETFFKEEAFAYIAHFNTSNIFKDKKFLNVAYKEQLFYLREMNVIGLSDLSKSTAIKKQLIKHNINRDFDFILDEDSHLLNEHGRKHTWLKAEELNFKSIVEGFNDFENSITYDDNEVLNLKILALAIQGESFLTNRKSEEGLIIPFSPYMTSLIGGRGSGKSTVLNTIEFLIGLNYKNDNIFNSIISQGETFLYLKHHSNEYIISFLGYDLKDFNAMMSEIEEKNRDRYLSTAEKLRYRRKKVLSLLQLWEIKEGVAHERHDKQKLFNLIMTNKFSIDSIVQAASSSEEVSEFLKWVLLDHVALSKSINFRTPNDINQIMNAYKRISQELQKQKSEKSLIINEFNNNNSKYFQLTYNHYSPKNFDFSWKEVFRVFSDTLSKPFGKFSINNAEIIVYFEHLSKIYNPFNLIMMIMDSKYSEIKNQLDIEGYLIRDDIVLENKLTDIKEEEDAFWEEVKRYLRLSEKTLVGELRRYYKNSEQWGIEFNINNRTGAMTKKVEYRHVSNLSMGQKVVAFLTFLLAFNEYTNNRSPLIIDQPEDHLDNQYIYHNLVGIFRNLKQNRQVIIATHNSTIVVNSSSEQVIVLDSDAKNGWMKKQGFSKNTQVIREILDILEGGQEAFKIKKRLYEGNL